MPTPQGADTNLTDNTQGADITIVSINEHIITSWKFSDSNPNNQYFYGADILALSNSSKIISQEIRMIPIKIDILYGPVVIKSSSNSCGQNSLCYFNITTTSKDHGWMLNGTSLTLGQYMIQFTLGAHSPDQKIIERSVRVTNCGNNITDTLGDDGIPSSDDEECDDGNWDNGDGCSSSCKIE